MRVVIFAVTCVLVLMLFLQGLFARPVYRARAQAYRLKYVYPVIYAEQRRQLTALRSPTTQQIVECMQRVAREHEDPIDEDMP